MGVNAFREPSRHKSGSTSACVGLSLNLYVSLYSRPESTKRRGRFKHPRVVRPCCTNVRRGGVLRKVSEAKRSSSGAACVVAAQLAAGDESEREECRRRDPSKT